MFKTNMKLVNNKLKIKYLFVIFLIAMLPACGDGTMVVLGPQQWQDLEFRVEVHPSPPRAGMTEFVVIASREVYKPGVGLVVEIRVGEDEKWIQAIQDGFTGVYRRAAYVADPHTQSLLVQVRRTNKDEQTLLSFPLNQESLNQESLYQGALNEGTLNQESPTPVKK